jgi:hypothetical protein
MDSRRKRDIPSGEGVCRVEKVWVGVLQLGGSNAVSKLGLNFEFVSDRRAKSVACGWMEDGDWRLGESGFDRKPFGVAQIKGLIGFSGACGFRGSAAFLDERGRLPATLVISRNLFHLPPGKQFGSPLVWC